MINLTLRKNIERLIASRLTAHTVSKETGVARNAVYKLFNGESLIDNITLINAEKLSKFWEESKISELEVLEIEGKEFYALNADYYANKEDAEREGYSWNEDMERWIKEI